MIRNQLVASYKKRGMAVAASHLSAESSTPPPPIQRKAKAEGNVGTPFGTSAKLGRADAVAR